MKKIFTILAALMLLTVSITAFASDNQTESDIMVHETNDNSVNLLEIENHEHVLVEFLADLNTIEYENAMSLSPQLENQLIQYLEENWTEHYTLSNFEVTFMHFGFDKNGFEAVGYIEFDTLLKYNSIEEMPFVQATMDVLRINSMNAIVDGNFNELYASQNAIASSVSMEKNIEPMVANSMLTSNEISEYSSIMSNLASFDAKQTNYLAVLLNDFYREVDMYIGEPTGNSIFFKFNGSIPVDGRIKTMTTTDQANNLTMLFQNYDETFFEPENLNPGDATQLYRDGFASINYYIQDVMAKDLSAYNDTIAPMGYSGYNRLAAAAWAGAYATNPTRNCYCGRLKTSNGEGVNYSAWCNTTYPYWDMFCHDDCANFVSQCMREGGLPTSVTGWYRVRYSPTDYGTESWRYVPTMRPWMRNQGYWDTSNFTNCNAGNIMFTDSDHITIVTKNDTITRTFNAHTNDRKNLVYYSGHSFYVINAN